MLKSLFRQFTRKQLMIIAVVATVSLILSVVTAAITVQECGWKALILADDLYWAKALDMCE
jgi:hypothetical protein